MINVKSSKWITLSCSNVDEASFDSLKAYPTITKSTTDESKEIRTLPLPKSVAFQGSLYLEFFGNDKQAQLDCKWTTSDTQPNLLKMFG